MPRAIKIYSSYPHLCVAAKPVEILEERSLNLQDISLDHDLYVEESRVGYSSRSSAVTANTPVHQKDLNEVSYSDFMLHNYGQAYQKQYNANMPTLRLKKV